LIFLLKPSIFTESCSINKHGLMIRPHARYPIDRMRGLTIDGMRGLTIERGLFPFTLN